MDIYIYIYGVSKSRMNLALALDRQAFDEILGSLRDVIDRNMSMRVIQSVPILKSLSPSSRAMLFAALTTVHYGDKENVISEGEPGSTFYIIKKGYAIVSKTSGMYRHDTHTPRT